MDIPARPTVVMNREYVDGQSRLTFRLHADAQNPASYQYLEGDDARPDKILAKVKAGEYNIASGQAYRDGTFRFDMANAELEALLLVVATPRHLKKVSNKHQMILDAEPGTLRLNTSAAYRALGENALTKLSDTPIPPIDSLKVTDYHTIDPYVTSQQHALQQALKRATLYTQEHTRHADKTTYQSIVIDAQDADAGELLKKLETLGIKKRVSNPNPPIAGVTRIEIRTDSTDDFLKAMGVYPQGPQGPQGPEDLEGFIAARDIKPVPAPEKPKAPAAPEGVTLAGMAASGLRGIMSAAIKMLDALVDFFIR